MPAPIVDYLREKHASGVISIITIGDPLWVGGGSAQLSSARTTTVEFFATATTVLEIIVPALNELPQEFSIREQGHGPNSSGDHCFIVEVGE